MVPTTDLDPPLRSDSCERAFGVAVVDVRSLDARSPRDLARTLHWTIRMTSKSAVFVLTLAMALSFAGVLLLTEATMTEIPDPKPAPAAPGGFE